MCVEKIKVFIVFELNVTFFFEIFHVCVWFFDSSHSLKVCETFLPRSKSWQKLSSRIHNIIVHRWKAYSEFLDQSLKRIFAAFKKLSENVFRQSAVSTNCVVHRWNCFPNFFPFSFWICFTIFLCVIFEEAAHSARQFLVSSEKKVQSASSKKRSYCLVCSISKKFKFLKRAAGTKNCDAKYVPCVPRSEAISQISEKCAKKYKKYFSSRVCGKTVILGLDAIIKLQQKKQYQQFKDWTSSLFLLSQNTIRVFLKKHFSEIISPNWITTPQVGSNLFFVFIKIQNIVEVIRNN